jgi:hypothetical protein
MFTTTLKRAIPALAIAALVGLAACSSSEGTDVASESPTATETDAAAATADEPAGQTDPQPEADSQDTGTQPPAQPDSGSQGTGTQPPAPPDPSAPDATTTPEPPPEEPTTPAPEETTPPTASVATVTVNEGLMEVSPDCFFDDDTLVLTYQQDTDKPDTVSVGDSYGTNPVYTWDQVPLSFTVHNLSSIIFPTPMVRSTNADLYTSNAKLRVKGTLGDVRIDYVHTQTWPDQFGPLPSLRYFSPSNRFCFVGISFDANIVELPAP